MDKFADEFLKELGIEDYDELTSVERETYQKMLAFESAHQISLEEFKLHIHNMRQSVEYELIRTEPYIYTFIFKRPNPKHEALKARLMNYLFFESFFDRPERARKILEQYKRRL